jgi:hypothetical protein
MRFPKYMTLVLLPLAGCGGLGQPDPYKGTIAFDGGSTEPFVVQVYNNELGSGNTDKQIMVELTADQTFISAGDTFRRVILAGSNANCTAKEYLRGKLERERSGACAFHNGWFEETVNGRKTGKTIKIAFDPAVLEREHKRLKAALRSP